MIDMMSITFGFVAGAACIGYLSGRSLKTMATQKAELQLKLSTAAEPHYIEEATEMRKKYREMQSAYYELLGDYTVLERSKQFSDQFFDSWDYDRSMHKEKQRIDAIRAAGIDPDYACNDPEDEPEDEPEDIADDIGQRSFHVNYDDLISLARTAIPGKPMDVNLQQYLQKRSKARTDSEEDANEIEDREIIIDDDPEDESVFGNWGKIETMTVADYFEQAPEDKAIPSALYGAKEPPKKEGGRIVSKDPKRRSTEERRKYAYLATCRGDSAEQICAELGGISPATERRLYNEGRAACNKFPGGKVMVSITNGTEVREVPNIDFDMNTGEWGFDKRWKLTTALAEAE